MLYIKLVDGEPTRYTIEEFLEEYPDVNVYTKVNGIPDKKVLEEYDVYPLVDSSPPEEGAFKEGKPQRLYNGEWLQTWEIIPGDQVKLPPDAEEISPLFFTTPEQKQERLAICYACDRWKPSTRQCKECGCFMDLKSKIKAADCPLGKWGKVV